MQVLESSEADAALLAGAARANGVVKRLFDAIVAFVLLLIASPVILLALLGARISTRDSGLFSQLRVGRGEQPFRTYKIRTMRRGSESDGSVTVRRDPRVTAFGEWLRRTKIDELPQLFNVLNGTMSLVGPRPTVDEDYARMSPLQRMRAAVRPGLTGRAQVSGNTALSWPQRIEHDLAYIRDWSLTGDLRILWQTGMLLLTGRAETHPTGADEWKTHG